MKKAGVKRVSWVEEAPAFVPAAWQVRRYKEGGGIVHFEGDPPFSCRFVPAGDYDYESWGQELAYGDDRSGLIFFAFAWRDEEPGHEHLAQLVGDMRRAIMLSPTNR